VSRQSWLLTGLLVCHLALTFAFSAINPLGEAPDEADHWAYIVHLARERRLPIGPTMTQSKHPPLYHASAAFVASLSEPANDFLRANPDVTLEPSPGWSPNFFIHTTLESWPWRGGVEAFHLVRLWSALLSTLAVAATYGLARVAFPKQPVLALTTAGFLAFLPEVAFIGAAANNDNAAALFGTLALLGGMLIYRNGGRLRHGWWTPLALSAGLLSKTSTVGVWPAVGLAILLGAATEKNAPGSVRGWIHACLGTWRRWVVTTLLVFGLGILIAAPWFARNWRLYGDPLGMSLAMQTIDLRTSSWTWAETGWLLSGWFVSFWGKFGGAGHIPMPPFIYTLLEVVSLASFVGLIVNFLPRRRRMALAPLLILLLSVGGVALTMWRYSLIALGTDQGRLLYPALGAIVILFVGGLLVWLPERRQTPTGLTIVSLTALLGVFALVGVLQPAFAPPATIDAQVIVEQDAGGRQQPYDFGDLSLVAWSLDDDPLLIWRTDAATEEDWRTVLRVVAADGTLIWEWQRSPGAGRWSTDHWPQGTLMPDIYAVRWPEWAVPGEYLVEIGVRPYGGELVVPAGVGGAHPFMPLGIIER
jgi:4-amino-4-deoxy-L-arabinose transferase-like glycosyltransferase